MAKFGNAALDARQALDSAGQCRTGCDFDGPAVIALVVLVVAVYGQSTRAREMP